MASGETTGDATGAIIGASTGFAIVSLFENDIPIPKRPVGSAGADAADGFFVLEITIHSDFISRVTSCLRTHG